MRNADANGLFSVGVNKNIAPTTPGTAVDVDIAPSTEQYVWGVTALSQLWQQYGSPILALVQGP